MTQPCTLDNRIPLPGDRPFPQPAEFVPLEERLQHLDRCVADLEEHREQLSLKLQRLAAGAEYAILAPRFDDLAERAARVRAIAEQTGSQRFKGLAAWATAICLFQRGAWDDLFIEASTAYELGWTTSMPSALAALAALHRDDELRAEPYIQRVADAARRLGPANGDEVYLAWVQSLQLRRAGRDHEALKWLVTGEHPAADWTYDGIYSPRVQATRLAVSLGDLQTLRQILAWNRNRADLHPGVRAHCQGLASHDPALLAQATGIYEGGGQKPQLAEAAEDLALLLAQHGDQGAARPYMTQAVQLYQDLGATWDLHRACAKFRAHGLRPHPYATRDRPTTGWHSLTRSEIRIAHLVAQGQSNPQIADDLCLSRRTVETHVSHILTKLGVRSRVDIVGVATAKPPPGHRQATTLLTSRLAAMAISSNHGSPGTRTTTDGTALWTRLRSWQH
jgi:DNA-binding CsgD family transcriptional regulator